MIRNTIGARGSSKLPRRRRHHTHHTWYDLANEPSVCVGHGGGESQHQQVCLPCLFCATVLSSNEDAMFSFAAVELLHHCGELHCTAGAGADFPPVRLQAKKTKIPWYWRGEWSVQSNCNRPFWSRLALYLVAFWNEYKQQLLYLFSSV